MDNVLMAMLVFIFIIFPLMLCGGLFAFFAAIE